MSKKASLYQDLPLIDRIRIIYIGTALRAVELRKEAKNQEYVEGNLLMAAAAHLDLAATEMSKFLRTRKTHD